MAIDKKKIFDYLWIPSFALGVIAIKVIASNPNLVQNIFPIKFPSKGKSVLFLGDSHTFPNSGWAEALVRKSGFKTYNKRAKNGANTSWMLGELTTFLQTNKAPDYLVVWGGANDAYGNIAQSITLVNMQAMIDKVKNKGTKVIFVTGYNPKKVSYNFDTRGLIGTEASLTQGRNRWIALIDSMPKKLKDYAKVIPPYDGFTRANSTDGLHLTMPSYVVYGEWLANKYFGG
jgi:hypothetical protein